MITNILYWVWLADLLPPAAAWKVFRQFGSPEQAFFSDRKGLDFVEGLSRDYKDLVAKKDLSAAQDIVARCDLTGVRIVAFQDSEYPQRLRNMVYPPLVIYQKGKTLRFDDRVVISMVGTRSASPYGKRLADEFAAGIVRCGGIVATGVTGGCDTIAARSALKQGGPLVLVVPGGVDVPYYGSESSADLLKWVSSTNCVLSEQPPGTSPSGPRFLRRNDILVALASGVLCVEGSRSSGAVRVALSAAEQGKDVFVLPANLDLPSFEGTNRLLSARLATAVLSPQDLMDRFSPLLPPQPSLKPRPPGRQRQPKPPRQAPPPAEATAQQEENAPEASEKGVDTASNSGYIELLNTTRAWTDQERTILEHLKDGPAHVEGLIAATGLNASTVSSILVMLNIEGIVQELPGGRFLLDERWRS